MHQRSWLSCQRERALLVLSALGLSVGCGDGYIGRECPASTPYCTSGGTAAEAERLSLANVKEISPPDMGPFAIKKLCESGCANPGGLLLPGPGDTAWSVPRRGASPVLQLLGPDGVVATHMVTPPPGPIDSLRPSYAINASGAALVRLQWDVARSGVAAPGPDELAVFDTSGLSARLTLEARSGVVRLPLGVLAVPSGYLLYSPERGAPLQLQLVAGDGAPVWRQREEPPWEASAFGGAVVALRSGGFMLTANQLGASRGSLGLMQLNSGGLFLRYLTPQPSVWRNVRMLPFTGSGTEYALAAEADLPTVADDGTGNLEIMRFGPGRDPIGVRMMRECYHAMVIKGFARDPEGNLFVSTVAGDRKQPHALLCRYSTNDALHCFAGEPGLIVEEIVATSAKTLFAAAGDEILRIELPE